MKSTNKIDLVSCRNSFLILTFGLSTAGMLIVLVLTIGLDIYYSDSIFDGGIQISLYFLAFFCFYILFFLTVGFGYFIQIEIDETMFCSVWFGRKICTIKTNEEIYYILFDAQEELFQPQKRFVLLSNSPIDDINSAISPVAFYKFKKYVILPYNDETKPCLKMDNWTCNGTYIKMK